MVELQSGDDVQAVYADVQDIVSPSRSPPVAFVPLCWY